MNCHLGSLHCLLSRRVWWMLKSLNLLAPRRGQCGGNQLRNLDGGSINVIHSFERTANTCISVKQRGIQVNTNEAATNYVTRRTTDVNKRQNDSLKSKIKIAHLNIRSIKNRDHLVQMRKLAEENDFNIIAISESWLNNTVTNAEVEIAGYKLSRLDRVKKPGGGLCVYTHSSLKTKVLKDLTGISNTGFHQLWLQVQHTNVRD